MRKVLNTFVVMVVAAPVLAFGQGGDANKVLADMRAALGGDKVAAVKSMSGAGRTMRTSQSGQSTENEFELVMELPDKYMMRSVIANMGPQMSIYRNAGFNGDGPINLVDTPPNLSGGGGGGVRVMMMPAGGQAVGAGGQQTPEQKAAADKALVLQQKKDFARLALAMFGQSFASFPLEFAYVGEAEAADGKAHVIDVKGADDFTGRLFVDQKTSLPLMMSWMAKEPLQVTMGSRGGAPIGAGQSFSMGGGATFTAGGGQQMTDEQRKQMQAEMEARMKEAEANRRTVEYRIYYSNFKTVGGVKIPHTFQRSVDGKPTEEMTFEQIRINPKIDPKKFEITK
jgi:hypothetical protein